MQKDSKKQHFTCCWKRLTNQKKKEAENNLQDPFLWESTKTAHVKCLWRHNPKIPSFSVPLAFLVSPSLQNQLYKHYSLELCLQLAHTAFSSSPRRSRWKSVIICRRDYIVPLITNTALFLPCLYLFL